MFWFWYISVCRCLYFLCVHRQNSITNHKSVSKHIIHYRLKMFCVFRTYNCHTVSMLFSLSVSHWMDLWCTIFTISTNSHIIISFPSYCVLYLHLNVFLIPFCPSFVSVSLALFSIHIWITINHILLQIYAFIRNSFCFCSFEHYFIVIWFIYSYLAILPRFIYIIYRCIEYGCVYWMNLNQFIIAMTGRITRR